MFGNFKKILLFLTFAVGFSGLRGVKAKDFTQKNVIEELAYKATYLWLNVQ